MTADIQNNVRLTVLSRNILARFIFIAVAILYACNAIADTKDEKKLSYSWSIDKPEDSGEVFTPYRVGAELIPDVVGDYYIKLHIEHPDEDKPKETVTIKVRAESINRLEAGKDRFTFDIGNLDEQIFIDKNDEEEEYPFVWAPYPIPFHSKKYSDDIFIRMAFNYGTILNSIDMYIDGRKKGEYKCGEVGVRGGETTIIYEDPTRQFVGHGDGDCTITIKQFKPDGRVVGSYDATVVSKKTNEVIQISGEFDAMVEKPQSVVR